MVQAGDWVKLHGDSIQGGGGPRIPQDMLLLVDAVDCKTICVRAPFEDATTVYWHHEYDVVEPHPDYVHVQGGEANFTIENCTFQAPTLPPYIIGDPPAEFSWGDMRPSTGTSTTVTIPATEPDLVHQPPHYKIKGDLEVIDVIESLAKDDYWYANAIKYLLRAKKKGKLEQDLNKCKFYIDRMLLDAESEAK